MSNQEPYITKTRDNAMVKCKRTTCLLSKILVAIVVL